jgi:hypothetical protein
MNIIETFLRLTSRTYPHGSEQELFDFLPDYLDYDEFGNRYIQVGDSTSVMFTSHLDTATSQKCAVNHVIDGKVCKTDGKSILGADDKAGVTIMLWMIFNKIPGLYYFFLGEEVGCVGSKALANKLKLQKIEGITKVISFDRRGFDSVITYQASSRCCSDKFAQALADSLNSKNKLFSYKPDPTGIWTDSAQFVKIYSECTNISVGYKSEHTNSESQDLDHLEQLADACLLVDWEALPVERDPSVVDYRSRYGDWDDWDYDYGYRSYTPRYTGGTYSQSRNYMQPLDSQIWFYDDLFSYVSAVTFKKGTKTLIDVDFSEERLDYEKVKIADFLASIEVEYDSFTWDGLNLVVKSSPNNDVICLRDELSPYIKTLDFWITHVEQKSFEFHDDAWSINSRQRDNLEAIF